MKTFFTADHHFDHNNIIHLANRPFSSVEEMNETMVERWNMVVNHNDIVYHLGDFAWGNAGRVYEIFGKLQGHIHVVEGNHDRQWWQKPLSYTSLSGYPINYLMPMHILKFRYRDVKKYVTLSHYAMRSWYQSFQGSWHLYGHSHGNLPPYGKSFDVGVDCWDFFPVSNKQMVEKMLTLKRVSSSDFEITWKELLFYTGNSLFNKLFRLKKK